MSFWYKIAYILSPVALVALRLHTKITGQQRARVLVFNEYGELLLLRSAIGHRRWSMPGGGIGRNEDPARGAARELCEETGIELASGTLKFVGVLRRPEIPVTFVMHLFTVTLKKADLTATLHNPLEIMEVGWFPLEQLPQNLSTQVPPALAKLSSHDTV